MISTSSWYSSIGTSDSFSSEETTSSFNKALKFESAFQSTIYIEDEDPEDYILDLIRVQTGKELKRLGSGLYAVAYAGQGKSTIFKVASGKRNPGYLHYFSHWSRSSKNPFFPVVYWSAMVINEETDEIWFVIEMERLLEFDSAEIIKRTGKDSEELEELLEEVADDIEYDAPVESLTPPKAFYEAKKVIKEIDEKMGRGCLDCHPGNFMFRKNGQLVITDPIC